MLSRLCRVSPYSECHV